MQVSECDMLVCNSNIGSSIVSQLHRLSDLQERIDSCVDDVHQMKESLSQKNLEMESITKTFEQKLEQYVSESQTKETCFEQKYSDIISLHETKISEIKSSVQQLEDKLEQWMENKTEHNQPIKIPDTFESLRSKLDKLIDSLVPKKVSMKRHIQLREDRNERRSSFHKKPRPKSELFFAETPVKIPRSSSVSSNTSASSVTSGYKSLPHQESGEISLPPDLSLITDDVIDPKASSEITDRQVHVDRNDQKSITLSRHKSDTWVSQTLVKSHPESTLVESISLETVARSVSIESRDSSVSSGCKSELHHNIESDETSLVPDLSPVGEIKLSIPPIIVTSETSSIDSLTTFHHPVSTSVPVSYEEAPDNAHLLLEVAWSMGDLLRLLNDLSISMNHQKKDEPDIEK